MKLPSPLTIAASALFWAGAATGGGIAFEETAAERGVAFEHHTGASGKRYLPETMGSGLAVFDADGDGDLDLFFVDGGRLPGYRGEAPRSRLFRNLGRGRFTDVTEDAGIEVSGYGMGAVVGDVEGDGDLDLFVTAFGDDQLFRNRGDGRFEDVTRQAGVGDPRWSASAAFGDVDRDGSLDLYVTSYLAYDLDDPTFCYDERIGETAYCHPDLFAGVPDRLYRGLGDGTFEDVTRRAGLVDTGGKGLGVVIADLDGDGASDLYVANDTTANFFFRGKGDGTFEDASLLSGAAFSDRGAPEAGMGIALGDADLDGLNDLFVTNYALETNAFYRNAGGGLFIDQRHLSGLARPSIESLGFGTLFADLDQDGDHDLVIANGHVLDNVEKMKLRQGITYRQRDQVMENLGGGKFRELAAALGEARASRGLASGDLDGDGDLDLVVTHVGERAALFENRSAGGGWLQVDLRQETGNIQAIGAKVTLVAGDRRQVREVTTGGSYLSHSALTLHFGLGGAERADRLEVTWPDGGRRILRGLPAGRRLRLTR